VSERPEVFPDWIAHRSEATPGRIALVVGNSEWTFAELDVEITRLARKLAALGVGTGGRVAVLLHNGFEMAMLPHAVLRVGATLVPLNVRLSEHELAWQLGDSKPDLLIVDGRTHEQAMLATSGYPSIRVVNTEAQRDGSESVQLLGHVAEADVTAQLEHRADAVLAIIYTSGTTGRPKGAMLTVSNFWWSAIGSALNLGTHADDKWLACMPLFHVGGLSILLRSAIYGITAVVHDGFDESAVNAAIDDGVTIVSVVAVMLERMLEERHGVPYPPTLRCVLLGGGPAPVSLLERSVSMAAPVIQTYGLTETCSQVATLSPQDAASRHGAAGKPLYANEIRIAPNSGSSTDDRAGEILVRGPIVMAGYFGQPDATTRAIHDGWLHTGDIGLVDDEGFVYVLDRRDDLIVTGGENVYPAEVEAALFSHPSVAEAGVIGVSDDKWGQRVVAITRISMVADGAAPDAAALASWCRARLAGYKIPVEFRFVSEPLPRTASGKLRRGALREIANAWMDSKSS
jgi:O-succinylbenzoic acid--CoA ligase